MQDGQQAMLALHNIGGKGIALVADQVINRDELVTQYVGEVVSLSQYVKREKEGGGHLNRFYDMAVSDTEVIDARNLGGMARFANHSCSPNCVVERWEVTGETCCGIFAKRDIHPGDELTIYYGKDPRAPTSRTHSSLRLMSHSIEYAAAAGSWKMLLKLY
ncbi:hypothetical protein PI124_g19235 [Phytophthora idaei]|nr:hypothetical protein PI124_g19235 [Phytophthora idaei]